MKLYFIYSLERAYLTNHTSQSPSLLMDATATTVVSETSESRPASMYEASSTPISAASLSASLSRLSSQQPPHIPVNYPQQLYPQGSFQLSQPHTHVMVSPTPSTSNKGTLKHGDLMPVLPEAAPEMEVSPTGSKCTVVKQGDPVLDDDEQNDGYLGRFTFIQ